MRGDSRIWTTLNHPRCALNLLLSCACVLHATRSCAGAARTHCRSSACVCREPDRGCQWGDAFVCAHWPRYACRSTSSRTQAYSPARTRAHSLMHSCRRVDARAGSNRLRPACRHRPAECPTATGPELRPRAAGQAAGQAVAGTRQPCTVAKREQATHRERMQRIFLGRIS